ncbi:MAG: hypothetical protein IPP91_06155 [Betaproteobacteria bacterium]|nr:hypothetical protein [Betaproteobacteria bacterium]
MPLGSAIPEWAFTAVAVVTVFTVMFDLGLAIVPGEFRWVWQRPALMLKGLFSVLVAVPALALVVTWVMALPRPVEVGIVLMALSPGAPVALRKSLGAGGHRSFAPALQIAVAVLATVSMPLSIAALNEYYAADATIAPWRLAKQVFVAQLLPLGLGMLARHLSPARAEWLAPRLARLGTWLLILLTVLALIDVWEVVVNAGGRVALAIAIATMLALAAGYLLGGPDPATRTAMAISSAARNPGLALLVATLNSASPVITATILSYLVVSVLTAVPFVMWRRRAAAHSLRL